ncbi:S-adenosyl methyltransferase [Haloactinospora alba]|uniref:S-adenosyl methyltransferase n=2 Tax=Haloactinospora alba TaxID=405555 RepID=A0A543NGZ4_9ACTN|nr:S-adenosyl methyltransferase [Haloactinospora alba]
MDRLDTPKFLKKTGENYKSSVPEPPDMSKPSIARVYSYYLGGKDHFEVDRDMAEYAESVVPIVTDLAFGNRAFVQRAVRYLSGSGIRQFLDIGSGLPTDGNVHEIAREAMDDARVVYVDHDPIVLAHGHALLTEERTTTVVKADLTAPQELLAMCRDEEILDFTQPIGLILGGILHHLSDEEEPQRITRELRDELPSGSYLAISHFLRPEEERFPQWAAQADHLQAAFLEKLGTGIWRDHDEILAYFGDWNLREPGLVPVDDWHPLPASSRLSGECVMQQHSRHFIFGGLAQKP